MFFSNYAKQHFCFIGKAVSVSSNSHYQRRTYNPVKHDGAFWQNRSRLLASLLMFDRIKIKKKIELRAHTIGLFNTNLYLRKYPFRLIPSNNPRNNK